MITFSTQCERRQSFRGVKRHALCCFVIMACVAGLSMQVVVGQADAQSKRQPITLVPGDYLRGDYLETLRKTHSPKHSDVAGAPQLIIVRKNATGISIQGIFNFPDGGPEFTMGKDGSVQVQLSGGDDTPQLMATVVDERHFKLGIAANPPETYTFVDDADRYVAAVVLVGRYADDRGRKYIFGKDGWAIFPDRKFRYAIGIDHVLNPYDYFEDETPPSKKVYAFKRVEGRMQLFETRGEIGEVVDKRPFVVLHAVSFK